MDNYKLKFQNGRNCTIECDSTKSFQDKINDAEIRFNSECIEINDKPIKKHSLGGFIVGATIGAILGNSVPAKTISKTASGVKRTAKNVTKSVKKQVKKFSGGGSTDNPEFEDNETDDISLWDNESLALYLGMSASWVKANREDAIEQAESLRDMSNEGYYAKGKKVAGVPRWWNKQVREYEFFVFNTETNKVWAGNEYQNDAKDELKEFLTDAPSLPLKVLSKRAITNKKINPLAYENWARGSEVIETIQKTFRKPEQMARGSKIKPKNNTQAVKGLVKDLENTPYAIGLAILRERLLTYSENDLRSLEKNPDAWQNPFISLGMYKDYYSRVAKELSFDSGKDNVKAVKGLVKDLENTPHAIGLAILRERLLTYAENDLKSMSKNPDAWSNPFISVGMYKDYANRVVEHLKFEFETGGMSSMAMAGAVPELAIADEVSKKLPETTSAIDKRLAERIYSNKPKWYEDRGMQYAGGGKVGDEITFKHWSGDIKTGTISEDLGNDNFEVQSGWGKVLVHKDDIVSGGKKFSGGGSTDNGGFIPNGYVTLIFNGKSYDFPARYEKVGENLVLEDINLVSSLHSAELKRYLRTEFNLWLENSNPASEYDEMYYGEDATYSVDGAVQSAIEIIDDELHELHKAKKPLNLDLDKHSEFMVGFE